MSIYNKSWFNTYIEKAGEKLELINAFAQKVKKLYEVKSILDLGSHDGTLLNKMLSHPSTNLALERVVGVDPADVSERFYQQIRSFSQVTQFYQTNAEQFLNQNMPAYDIILASQCLYWSEDLSNLISLIDRNSRAACVVLRGNRGIYEIQSHFKDIVGNKDEKYYTSKNIVTSLEKNNIPYQRQTFLSEIVMPEKRSEHWYFMLSFFLQTDIFKLSQSVQSRVEDFIDNLMTENRVINHQVEFFWLGEWQ